MQSLPTQEANVGSPLFRGDNGQTSFNSGFLKIPSDQPTSGSNPKVVL